MGIGNMGDSCPESAVIEKHAWPHRTWWEWPLLAFFVVLFFVGLYWVVAGPKMRCHREGGYGNRGTTTVCVP